MNLVVRALAMVGLGAVIGGVHSWLKPVELTARAPVAVSVPVHGGTPSGTTSVVGAAPPGLTPAPSPEALGLEITLAQAKALWDEGVAFVDARRDDEWPGGVVSGAHLINVAGFNTDRTRQALQFIDPTRPVVIYCGGGDCHDSHNLAILFQQSGYARVHIMTDGFPGWKAAGYDTVIPPAQEGP